MSAERNAVIALLEHETEDEEFTVSPCRDEKHEFQVEFSYDKFNDIVIRVSEVDEDYPEMSEFSIHAYDDMYEEFNAYSFSIKEFWKAILWK